MPRLAKLAFLLLSALTVRLSAVAADANHARLDARFNATVHPFLETYCFTCHGRDKTEAELDLTTYSSFAAVAKDPSRWELLLERLESEEMPPSKAKRHPADGERRQAIDWFRAVRDDEIRRHAGDPGVVLARRLSNAEYNYTIRDLTGVDTNPTREFPQDPSNAAGFDNSGESLVMSPALLKKYLGAAREIANQMYLKPHGFGFAPFPMLVETDRDKFCVQQIIDFYHRQNIDYADYFEAAWRYKHRAALGQPKARLAEIAASRHVSAKYLTTIWQTLEETNEEVGPLRKLQAVWRALPVPKKNDATSARSGCEQMRQYVVETRKKVEMRFLNITAGRVGAARQPMLIWKDVQYATHRRKFDAAQLQVEGEDHSHDAEVVEPDTTNNLGPGKTQIITNTPGDPDLLVPAGERAKYEAAFGRFCSVFPDMFYKEERGRNYFDTTKDRGRYLSAGFHNVMGYFRDDQPLYELLLDEKGQQQLDAMWFEMDFVASTTTRMYIEFGSNREALGTLGELTKNSGTDDPEKLVTSESSIRRLEEGYLNLAMGGSEVGLQAIKDYFSWVNATIRRVEQARRDAEPTHLQALCDFAARAYRRPLAKAEKDDLLGFYRSLRKNDGMDHEPAVRETLVAILMSPDLCYRIDLAAAGNRIRPLSDYDVASRLSYFLWSSIPDAELLAHANTGDLHEPKVMMAQARRMLQDPKARALAVEFAGNWLDFRRFEGIGTVDLQRFPAFTPKLRKAMYEEPVRFFIDVARSNRSVLDFIYAKDTFVNAALARHYGMPSSAGVPDEWVHVADATTFGRGGLLPMAVFLTKNAPGLRTSPVKRGNWVVKNILGERIPAPPPNVPELPRDESTLGLSLRDTLARHRADPNCASCHARFDSMGLVFEGFGPVGDRRDVDLGGRPVDVHATFPGGADGAGLDGLQKYIRASRQQDFVDNLCRKLLVYALGRSLIVSDELLIDKMRQELRADGYRFGRLIDTIVTSPQFLTKRGRDDLAAR